MPKLYVNQRTGRFYTRRAINGRIVTLQLTDEGSDFLHDIGLGEGDELGEVYWDLVANGWVGTLREHPGSGEVAFSDDRFRDQALSVLAIEPSVLTDEPLTIPCAGDLSTAPRFLYASRTSIYYTVLHVENSSDSWLEVPILIKHYAAMELLERGAVLGEEFTETGLRMLFQNRWGYFDEDRYAE